MVSVYDKVALLNGGRRREKNLVLVRPFAWVIEGGAGARTDSMSAMPGSNYVMRDRALDDAVVIKLPVWIDLVRQTYKA